MTVRLTAGEEQIEVSFPVEVVGAALPPQTLVHTEWFHADCLATWYGVEPLSEEHWTILGKYMKNAAAYGINLLLTPVFTPAAGHGGGRGAAHRAAGRCDGAWPGGALRL